MSVSRIRYDEQKNHYFLRPDRVRADAEAEKIETRGEDVHPMVGIIGLSTANIIERTAIAHDIGFRVFQTVIPRNVRLSEAPSHGKPVLLYDIQSKGAIAYLKLADELLRRSQPSTNSGGIDE